MTRRLPAPLAWLAGLLALYLLAPLIAGAQQARLAHWSQADAAAILHACEVSVASATVSTVLIGIGGIPLGYWLARTRGRSAALLGFLVQLPLALPPLASGILLLFLVGYTTPLGHALGGVLTDSFAGIVLAQVFVASPFLIIAARSAFAATDPILEGVGATLGHEPLDVFLRVSLPLAWPIIIPGLLLAWLRAFGEFGATVMVAYHPYSLPVYTYVAFGAQGLPAMMPVLLPTLVVALGVMAVTGTLAGRRRAWRELPARMDLVPAGRGDTAARTAPSAATGAVLSAAARTAIVATDRPVPVAAAGAAPGAFPSTTLALDLEKQLDGFRLSIAWSPHARRLAILGPSGSGKSLTLRLIAGVERADHGRILVNNTDLAPLDPAARAIAYVPQRYGLFPHLTVQEQLAFPVGADPLAAAHWIARLGLHGLERRRPAALSLGQQQRVALARALVRPASLLLLDEPFSALDTPLRARLRQELLALQGELSAATILVTHDPTEAALLADEILLIEGGRALQSGTTSEVFRRPANERAARLLGAENAAEGVVAGPHEIGVGRGVTLVVGGPALTLGARVGWSCSATRARMGTAGTHPAVVQDVATVGIDRQVTLRLGDAEIKILDGHCAARRGDACRVDIDPDSIQVWPLDPR
ncbi:MAG: ATP-binding cassette domain-containing protein [Steroidobacteraceae bacterium]